MGQDDNFGFSGPTHALVIRSFITTFHFNSDNTPTPEKDQMTTKGNSERGRILSYLNLGKGTPHKGIYLLKEKLAASNCFTVVGIQLPKQLTVSSQFTKLSFNDSLISSLFMDQKTFSNGMAGKRPLHLEDRSRSLIHLVRIMKYWNIAT